MLTPGGSQVVFPKCFCVPRTYPMHLQLGTLGEEATLEFSLTVRLHNTPTVLDESIPLQSPRN